MTQSARVSYQGERRVQDDTALCRLSVAVATEEIIIPCGACARSPSSFCPLPCRLSCMGRRRHVRGAYRPVRSAPEGTRTAAGQRCLVLGGGRWLRDLAKKVHAFGASVAARDHAGGTALTHAARSGDVAVIKLLVAQWRRRGTADGCRFDAAVRRAESDRPQAVQALIAAGAKVNVAGRGGVTPLSAAAYNGRLKIVDVLLTHGADANQRDNTGKTPLLYAAARGFKSVVDRLLATGIDVNAAYGNDLTVLMWAAGHADDVPVDDGVTLVTALLDKGAKIDAVDDRGRTALMTAAERGHDEIVALLLQPWRQGRRYR